MARDTKITVMFTDTIIDLMTLHTYGRIFHWQTRSYASHKAIDEFLTKLFGKTDEIVEMFQGMQNKRLRFSKKNLRYVNVSKQKLIRLMTSVSKRLQKLDNVSMEIGSAILNVRDEIVGLIQQTQYLLSFNTP